VTGDKETDSNIVSEATKRVLSTLPDTAARRNESFDLQRDARRGRFEAGVFMKDFERKNS
jgi:hypothetical protein